MTQQRFKAPNSTLIPNDVFDEMMRDMNDTELRVMLAIMRIRSDFGRQVTFELLSELTGLTLVSVKSGFWLLCQRGLTSPSLIEGRDNE